MLAPNVSLPMLGPWDSSPAVVSPLRLKRQLQESPEIAEPISKRSKVTGKRVKFSDHVDCRRVEKHGDSVDDGGICSRWYQHEEYQEIKQDNRDTVREVAIHAQTKCSSLGYCDLLDFCDEQYCTRGLEIVMRAWLLRMPPANRQKKVVTAVLCMQQFLRQMDHENNRINLEEPLRAASTAISGFDMLCALQRGATDASNRAGNAPKRIAGPML